MFPGLTQNDTIQRPRIKSEFTGERGLGDIAYCCSPSDFPDQRFSQRGSPISFPARDNFGMQIESVLSTAWNSLGMQARSTFIANSSAPLSSHVGMVVGNGANPQMAVSKTGDTVDGVCSDLIVPDASGDIAGVERPEPFGQGAAVRQLQSEVVSANTTSVVALECAVPITDGGPGSSPQPVFSGAVYLGPKTLNGRDDFGGICARFDAVTPPSMLNLGWGGKEVFATLTADTRDGTLVGHRSHSFGVAPRAVTSSAGAFSCLDFTMSQRGA